MNEDIQALQQYVKTGSDEAFARIVNKHMKLVYATCLRETGHITLAEDATQLVFIILARKARTVANYRVLSGWLYRTSRFAASDVMKKERRARRLESAALTDLERGAPLRDDWFTQHRTVNEALSVLTPVDREAVLLKFFDGFTAREIAAALAISNDAAERRVTRAIARMRTYVERHGITTSAGLVALFLLDAAKPAPAQSLDKVLRNHGGVPGPAAAHAQGILHGAMFRQVATVCAILVGILIVVGLSTNLYASLPNHSAPPRSLAQAESVAVVPSTIDFGAPFATVGDCVLHFRVSNGVLNVLAPPVNELGSSGTPNPTQPFEGNAPSNPAFTTDPPATADPVADVAARPQLLSHETRVWSGPLGANPTVFVHTATATEDAVTDEKGDIIWSKKYDAIVNPDKRRRLPAKLLAAEYQASALRAITQMEQRQIDVLRREGPMGRTAMSKAQLQRIIANYKAACGRILTIAGRTANYGTYGNTTTKITISVDHGTMEIRTGTDNLVAINTADIATLHFDNTATSPYYQPTFPQSLTVSPIVPTYTPPAPGIWHITFRGTNGAFVVREVIHMDRGRVLRYFTDQLGNPAIGRYAGTRSGPVTEIRGTVRTLATSFWARLVGSINHG